jgi:hypothetical protein
MSNQNTQMIGASHVAKARALLARADRKLADFWWCFPPQAADNVLQTNAVALPDTSTAPQIYTPILQYQVPSGMVFVLTGVIFQVAVAGVVSQFAPGSLLGLLDLNAPIGTESLPIPVGTPIKGFNALSVSLGSFPFGPWPLAKPFVFDPLDVLRWKVTNITAATDTVFVAAGLFGYTLPLDEVA